MPKLTVFTSVSTLTKTFWADGKAEKNPNFFSGSFSVKDISSHSDLKTWIESLSYYQALCYSTPLELTSGTIVTEGNENEEQGIISRTKKYFNYPGAEGWLFIDSDENFSESEVLEKLTELFPPFGQTSYVYATSASHGIGGKRGFHLYFKVNDISIVKKAMDNLFNSAFNAGYGKCIVTAAGRVLNRTFFDKAVYDRARLDFISGPKCVDFTAPTRDIRIVEKENQSLDLTPLLAYVDATEAIKKERCEVRGEEIAKSAKAAKKRGLNLLEYQALLYGGELKPGTKLLQSDNTEIDVAAILKTSMEAYLREEILGTQAIQHPVEQGLEEKTILYFNSHTGVPSIHTFAHGRQTWKLIDDGSVLGGLYESFPDSQHLIENLKAAHGLTSSPTEATKLPLHPDTYAVLHLMLKTFLMDYQSERLLIDQWREMISLFLHLIDGHRGRYSIELPPSHGKTQVICHVILWLYQSKRIVPISLSVFKIDDIEVIKNQLLERLDKQWRSWETEDRLEFLYEPKDYLKVRHSKERTDFEELDNTPVIIHTHHVVRRNDFNEKFFTYKGRERHLFIFDEAMFRSLQVSQDLVTSIDHLGHAITRCESGTVKGLPVEWLKAFKAKVENAMGMLKDESRIQDITIEMPKLSERFVNTGYYLKDEKVQNFILSLMNIGAADKPEFRVSREQGGQVLFAFKENDISKLPRVINTDATRSVRRVHKYGSDCLRYPIEPYEGDEGVTYWIAPNKYTGKEKVHAEPMWHLLIANLWLKKIKPKKVLVIASKGTQFESPTYGTDAFEKVIAQGLIEAAPHVDEEKLKELSAKTLYCVGSILGKRSERQTLDFDHPDVHKIHWGQHKQTNDYKGFDAVIVMNYFRKPPYTYKHDIHSESGTVDSIPSGAVKEVEIGFIVDELIQGFCRGAMREGKAQNCLMFSPYSDYDTGEIGELLEKSIRSIDKVEIYKYPRMISAFDPNYITAQERSEQKRKTRSDKVYESQQDKEQAKNFRKACKKRGVENPEELLEPFLQEKRDDSTITPAKWLKENIRTETIVTED